MPPQSKGKKSSKTTTQRSGTNWTLASLESSALILSAVKEAATFSPVAELKKAACTALLILQTVQIVKENREAYERLGDDSSGLIAVIWRSFKKAEVPEEWLSEEMREILEDLTHTLESICSFVQEQLSRSKAIRVIFSRADGVKINEYREHLNYAMQKFELQSHMNINDVLVQLMRKNDQISEQILHRNEEEEINHALAIIARDARDREIAEKLQEGEIDALGEISNEVEIDSQVENDRLHSEELKKIEKEAKDRKSQLERLRATASAIEEANRLKKAEEEEIAQLERALAAEEDRQNNRARKKKSSREDDEDEEEEWEGNFNVEEATSEEEEGEDRPVRWSSKMKSSEIKRSSSGSPKRRPVALEDSTYDNEKDLRKSSSKTTHRKPSGSPNRRPVALGDFTDDDEKDLRKSSLKTARRKLSTASLREENLQSMKSSKIRMSRRNASSASLHVQETEDEDSNEEDYYVPPPPRKSPKVKRKPHTSPGNLPYDVNDLMGQFQGFTPMGLANPHWSGSGSPMHIPGIHSNPYIPTHGASFSPPIIPYGHGIGIPGSIVNSGVGNIISSTIANVGNNNSVNKVYRSSHSRRRGDGN